MSLFLTSFLLPQAHEFQAENTRVCALRGGLQFPRSWLHPKIGTSISELIILAFIGVQWWIAIRRQSQSTGRSTHNVDILWPFKISPSAALLFAQEFALQTHIELTDNSLIIKNIGSICIFYVSPVRVDPTEIHYGTWDPRIDKTSDKI